MPQITGSYKIFLEGRKLANEKIYNNHCFIRRSNDRRVYCSKCGKLVMQDTYNLKCHAEKCGFSDWDFVSIFREKSDFAYAFRGFSDRLKFYVFAPVLKLRPGFKDRYTCGEWKLIYHCTFWRDRKRFRKKDFLTLLSGRNRK